VEGTAAFFESNSASRTSTSGPAPISPTSRGVPTLTHEQRHVILHGFLFAMVEDLKKLFDGQPKETRNICHRDHMHGGGIDWMEWQAGFACGALLMPQTELVRVVKVFRDDGRIQDSDGYGRDPFLPRDTKH
jgi:hypothetical protein